MGFFLGYMMGSSSGTSGSYNQAVLDFMKISYVEYSLYAMGLAFIAITIYSFYKKYKEVGTIPSHSLLMLFLMVLASTPLLNYTAFSQFIASTLI